ncbi:MAG: TlpA family protein disulfide reductase [Chitinophagaceae bacterium]|nr:TlpA family protein disulfide reductase [Chitinophagaceae bacterium]
MRNILFCCAFILLSADLIGQTKTEICYPEVGKLMPDFTLRNIMYYPKKTARLSDFKGKWLLLDFWNKFCGACIASFPHTNEVQKQLGNQVQVMLVGIQDMDGEIEKVYAKYRKVNGLTMPCAFDSTLANRFDIFAGPYSILIDEKGIVRCITLTLSVNDMKGFLSGNPPDLPAIHRQEDGSYDLATERVYQFDDEKPYLLKGNGGEDTGFLFRTVLSSWFPNKQRQSMPYTIAENLDKGRFQALGVPLEWLYSYAFFGVGRWGYGDTLRYGKFYGTPILETRDSAKFQYSYKYGKNLYAYSLWINGKTCTEASVKATMQKDLDAFFGFETKIESRSCPYWSLIAAEEAKGKLRSKGGRPYFKELIHAGFSARNWSFKEFMKWLTYHQRDLVILDESGFSGNMDIDMDCIPENFDDLKKALKSNGLDLVPGKKEMKVLVIRD